MISTVYIEKIEEDFKKIESQINISFQNISIIDDFNRAKAVFIKPNLTYPIYKKGVTIRKAFIEALVVALRNINGKTKIYIGEGRMWIQQLIHVRWYAGDGILRN